MTPEQLLQQAGGVVRGAAEEYRVDLALRVARCIDERRQAYLADPSMPTIQRLHNAHLWATIIEGYKHSPMDLGQQQYYAEAAEALEAGLTILPAVSQSGERCFIVSRYQPPEEPGN